MDQARADVLAYAQDVWGESILSKPNEYVNFIIYGAFGTGKTSVLGTAPKPILIFSFDPGGCKTRYLQPMIERREVIVDTTFENIDGDDWRYPKVWEAFEDRIEDMENKGIFEHIGTFCVDPFTRASECLMHQIMHERRPKIKKRTPTLPDYMHQQFTAVQLVAKLSSLPCHVILTAHLQRLHNEKSGGFEQELLFYGKLAQKLPPCLDEKYMCLVQDESRGQKYVFQTQNTDEYAASTRIGGCSDEDVKPVFKLFESQNIRRLLRKAGRSFEDKPPLF